MAPHHHVFRATDPRRRAFLKRALSTMGLVVVSPVLARCSSSDGTEPPPGEPPFGSGYNPPDIVVPSISNIANIGPLGAPDADGLRLPDGFTARIVGRSGQTVEGTDYVWHAAPDGGATFLSNDGGWVYVSNSEVLLGGDDGFHGGGVGALHFDEEGTLIDAYSILSGTAINCAGGPTPWGTWLSCEELPKGQVWECDPFGARQAKVRPALGVFKHEAAAVDPVAATVYLTEDEKDGRFYRFIPDALINGRPDLSAGSLQVLRVTSGEQGATTWLDLPDPEAKSIPTRMQLPESTAFKGGEGIWFHEGSIYFTTKGDDRVWIYDTESETLSILYDVDIAADSQLSGVDNLMVSPAGDVVVAEDGGDMQLIAITPAGDLVPLVQIVGQDDSEITGPALDPYRKRLYFSSQRGPSGDILGTGGISYEITGPFFVEST
jgi:hypothetical protein